MRSRPLRIPTSRAKNAREMGHPRFVHSRFVKGGMALRLALVVHLLATAAMQLISTSESPGNAATATVVRAGPP